MSEQASTQNREQLPEARAISSGEVIIGELAGISNSGQPLVIYENMTSAEPLPAMTTQEVTTKHIGRQVALLFANGKSNQPVIVGLVHNPLSDILENFRVADPREANDTPFPEVSKEYSQFVETDPDQEKQVLVDGRHVTIEGAEEITLRCGKASITLTKSGKILIRGTYLSNRSSGVNRILGGSVQIN